MLKEYLKSEYTQYKQRKISLVNPPDPFFAGMMPLGIASLSAYLKLHGVSNIETLDSNCENINQKYIHADIVGVTAVTQSSVTAANFARFVKARHPDTLLVFGGVHMSTSHKMPEPFDVGVVGEGEVTMLELVMLPNFSIEELKKVPGICYRDENRNLKFTVPRLLVKNLDEFPIPDRESLNLDHYVASRLVVPGHPGRTLSMLSSRGCPFTCRFCSTKVHWSRFRAHSAERVVEELELLVDTYGAEVVELFDDLFTANKKRMFKIRDLMVEKGLNKRVQLMVLSRSDNTDDEVMKALKDMNVVVIGAGFESASQKMIKYIKKDTTTVQDHRNLIALAEKYGILIMASFLIGNPTETREDLEETLAFIREYHGSPAFVPLTYIAAVFPGTEYYDIAKERGLPVDEYDRILMDINPNIESYRRAPLLTELPIEEFFKISHQFM
jgi:radical SAM superfamily enzyme YgiQ (UPF0313 family)